MTEAIRDLVTGRVPYGKAWNAPKPQSPAGPLAGYSKDSRMSR